MTDHDQIDANVEAALKCEKALAEFKMREHVLVPRRVIATLRDLVLANWGGMVGATPDKIFETYPPEDHGNHTLAGYRCTASMYKDQEQAYVILQALFDQDAYTWVKTADRLPEVEQQVWGVTDVNTDWNIMAILCERWNETEWQTQHGEVINPPDYWLEAVGIPAAHILGAC